MAVHKVLALFESIDNITPTADRIGGSLGKLEGIAKKVGLGIAAGLAAAGVAATAFVGNGIKMASEFQDQLAIMSVATKDFGLDMGTLRQASLAVGGDVTLVGVSATSAADAITGLAKAGLSSTEVFGDLQGYLDGTEKLGGALRASIDLAAASELDMVQASDLAAVALATFGGQMETEAERAEFVNMAMDNMVKAADASVASVSSLADAMKNVGPTAASFGFSLQDTNTALALLSTRGIEGGEAGTVLKSMMTNMMRTTDDVTEALSELNVELFDSTGQMKSMPNIIGQLQKGMAGLTQEQKLQYIQTLAGTYGMKAMSTLVGEGIEGWEAMEAAIDGAAGIQEQAAARTATLSGKMEGLGGVLETLQIEIGSAFLPLAEQVVEWAASMADTHGPKLISLFQSVAAAIQIVISVLTGAQELSIPNVIPNEVIVKANQFGFVLRELMGALKIIYGIVTGGEISFPFDIPQETIVKASKIGFWLRNTIALVLNNKDAIISAFIAIGRAIASMMVARKVGSVIKALTMLTNPLGIILALVGVLAFAWKSNFGDIQGKTKKAWATLQPIFSQIADWLQTNIPKAIDAAIAALKPLWDWLSVNIPAAIETLQTIFNTVWPAIQELITTVVNEISALWTEVFGMIVAWTQENMPLIQATIDTVFTAIQTMVQSALTFIQDFWAQHGAALMATVSASWELIKIVVTTAVSTILGIVKTIMQIIQGDWDGAWATIRATLETVWEAMKAYVATAMSALPGILAAGMMILQAAWETAWTAIKVVANGAWQFISTGLTNMFTAWGEAINAGMAVVKALWDVGITALKTKAGEVWDWIKAKFFAGVTAITNIVSGVKDKMGEAGAAVVEALKQGIEGAWDSFVGWLRGKLGDLTNMLPFSMPKDPSSPLRKLQKGGANIPKMIARGAQSQFGMLQDTMSNMLGVAFPGMGNGSGNGMQFAGVGATAGSGNIDRSSNQTFILNYTAGNANVSGSDEAASAMREIEVAAKLRR